MTLSRWLASLSVAVLAGASALAQCKTDSALAGSEDPQGARKCCAATKTGCDETAGACAVKALSARAGAALPEMQYRVGEKTTCCPMEAEKLANGDKAAIRFVVADKTFENEADARKAYAEALEGFLNSVMTVKFAVGEECVSCPMTAKALAQKQGKPVRYRVAAFDFPDEQSAGKAIEAARQAAEKVHLTMKVGDKTFQCPVSADDAAKAEGKPVEYCVGSKASPCKATACVELALARIDAALAELAKAGQG